MKIAITAITRIIQKVLIYVLDATPLTSVTTAGACIGLNSAWIACKLIKVIFATKQLIVMTATT